MWLGVLRDSISRIRRRSSSGHQLPCSSGRIEAKMRPSVVRMRRWVMSLVAATISWILASASSTSAHFLTRKTVSLHQGPDELRLLPAQGQDHVPLGG